MNATVPVAGNVNVQLCEFGGGGRRGGRPPRTPPHHLPLRLPACLAPADEQLSGGIMVGSAKLSSPKWSINFGLRSSTTSFFKLGEWVGLWVGVGSWH